MGKMLEQPLLSEKSFLDKFRYQSVPGFLYPSRLLCVFFVSLTLSYQLMIITVIQTGLLTHQADQWLEKLHLNATVIAGILRILIACVWVSFCMLLIVVVGALVMIFKTYREHMLQLYRGDKSFIPRHVMTNRSAPELMSDSMRWAGYQTAFLLSGFFFFYSIFLLVLLIISEVVYLLVALHKTEILLSAFQTVCLPLLLTMTIYYLQQIWSLFFFLQKSPDKTKPVPLAVDNRRAFETVNYFTFFINVTNGVFSSVLRLLISCVIGIVTLCRIDQPLLKKGYERFDRGHRAYISMLLMDYTHNHPVLRVFCAQLVKLGQNSSPITSARELRDVHEGRSYAKTCSSVESKGKRRWFLAYTLLNNPELIQYRKNSIGSMVNSLAKTDPGPISRPSLLRYRQQVAVKDHGEGQRPAVAFRLDVEDGRQNKI